VCVCVCVCVCVRACVYVCVCVVYLLSERECFCGAGLQRASLNEEESRRDDKGEGTANGTFVQKVPTI